MPINGHVTPLLSVARHLSQRGDQVRFLTGKRFADAVTATGATQVPLPEEADFDDLRLRDDLLAVFPDRGGLKGTKALAFDIEHIFVRPGRPQYDAVLDLLAQQRADVLMTDPAFAGGALLTTIPRDRRPPVIIVGAPLPANARAAEFLPYDELLPKTSVYVTNGGYGGVQYALRHGVPIVATGGQEDKPEVGARVAWSGVGVRLRTDRPSARALGRAIRKVLADDSYRTAATGIAAKIQQAPGLTGLAAIIDELASRDPTAG